MKILDVPRSGSYQGLTSSHNRFGQYVRTRATPTNPNSSYQSTARVWLAEQATSWRSLTAAQRDGWVALGLSMTRTDGLGQSYNLTGLQAFVSVNCNRLKGGGAVVSDAPGLVVPDPLLTLVLTLNTGAFSLAFTVTPLPDSTQLFVYASPQKSAGRDYESDVRLFGVSGGAIASPYDAKAGYEARFGALVLGNRIFVEVRVHSAGFLSAAIAKSAVVIAP